VFEVKGITKTFFKLFASIKLSSRPLFKDNLILNLSNDSVFITA
jgi:hypothetical protein